MNFKAFYATLKAHFGKLTQDQVNGINAILAEWIATMGQDDRHLAYMLATAWHETAQKMQAISEYGKGKGKKYGAIDKKTGHAYYGRGLVQLTWARNYQTMGKILNIPLYEHPELALSLPVAVDIMFDGMFNGIFTGKKLSDYFNKTKDDPIGARRIINGKDRSELIAGYHAKFLDAIKSAHPAVMLG
jgi:putative chitinase